MAMRGPLRYELTKYRKGKRHPLSGVVPGIQYNSYGSSRRPVSGMPYRPGQTSYSRDSYNWTLPRDYHPSLNAPAVQETEYDPYEPLVMHNIARHDKPRLPREFNDDNQEVPIPMSVPDDDLSQTEQFLMAMGERDEIEQVVPEVPLLGINEQNLIESQLPVEERSIDELPSLEDLIDAFIVLADELPEGHPDLVNLRSAMRQVRDHQISLSEMDETDAIDPLGAEMEYEPVDPHQEAQQFFDQQMELLDKSFDEPAEVGAQDILESQGVKSEMLVDGLQPDESCLEEHALDSTLEQENSFEATVPELEELMPDEMAPDTNMPYAVPEQSAYDAGLIADEINQAIDEVSQMPQEMEPDPFQPQYDPYMMDQNMLDQMQYMANPFIMPDPCGPMGPMPGP